MLRLSRQDSHTKINCPYSSPRSHIQYTLRIRIYWCKVQLVVQCDKPEVMLHIYPISIFHQSYRSRQYLIVLVLSISTCYQPSVTQSTNLIHRTSSFGMTQPGNQLHQPLHKKPIRYDVPRYCLPCIYGMCAHFPLYNRRHSTVRTAWSACPSHTLACDHV